MDGGAVRSEFKKMKYVEFEEERAKTCNFGSGFRWEGELTKNIPSTLDLNAKSNYLRMDDAPSCFQDANKLCFLGKPQEMESTKFCGKPKSFGLDLNSEDVSSSVNHEPFHLYNTYEHVQARDTLSECGSTCGLAEAKDPMRIWKQMKQNGFLSSSHGSVLVPPMPKTRGRKKGNESVIKKKIEIAKKEQVDRFAKVAAPSGLLNELNPGIINHVRNRRQVHSIIENLMRSSRNKNKNSESKQDDGPLNHSSGVQRASYCLSGELNGDDDSSLTEREEFIRSTTTNHPSYPNKEHEDDVLALKLSSASTMASENMSSLSNDESTVTSLSVKAAGVASQWLELLHQDIKGRLAALRRSKKRVRAVTQTELPFLISRDLCSNQENDPPVVISSENGVSCRAHNDMHKLRWIALFNQMDKSLSEEENHLENSLNQVREMLLHCEHGLLQDPQANGLHEQATMQPNHIFPVDKDLAVRAAAAAIYSTSNFVQSAENLPCF